MDHVRGHRDALRLASRRGLFAFHVALFPLGAHESRVSVRSPVLGQLG